jgi:uncharacterized protein YrrD
MHITELRGLRIISLSETLKMGKVEDVLLDPTAHFVAALRVRSGGAPGSEHIVPREAVKRVGQQAVVLGMPTGMGIQKQPDLDRLIDLQTFLEMDVVSEEGTRLGRIHDAEIDPQTLNITNYEMTRRFWDAYLNTRVRVSARETLSGSKDVLIVPQEALRKVVSVSEGVDVPKEW